SVETREVYSSPDFAPSGSMPTNATGYAVETEVCGMACSLLGGLRDGARRAPSVAVRFDHVGAGLVGLRLLDGEGVGVQMVARDDVVGSGEGVRARGRALDSRVETRVDVRVALVGRDVGIRHLLDHGELDLAIALPVEVAAAFVAFVAVFGVVTRAEDLARLHLEGNARLDETGQRGLRVGARLF